MKYILPLLTAFLAFIGHTEAQDERFSQFFAIPVQLNPALTGAYEGTYRMSLVYRDQWNNSLDTPYKTFAVGGDTKVGLNFASNSKDHFGVGLFFTSDRVAEFQANTNNIAGYFAYHKKLTERNPSYIGAGIKLGVIQRNINYDNLTFGDTFDQINAFEGPTSEILPPNNIGFFDASIGLNYYINIDKKTKYYAGFAYHHLTNPNISFFNRLNNPNPNLDLSETLLSRYTFHFSMDKLIKYNLEWQPRFVYQTQGQSTILSIGSNVQYNLKQSSTGLVLGLWVSGVKDLQGSRLESLTPLVGLIYEGFILGMSYDVPMTDTFETPFNFNTFELSIRYSGEHQNDAIFCPTF